MDEFKKKAATKEWGNHITPLDPKNKKLNKTIRARMKRDLVKIYKEFADFFKK